MKTTKKSSKLRLKITDKESPKKSVKKPSLATQLKNAKATNRELKGMLDVLVEENTKCLVDISRLEKDVENFYGELKNDLWNANKNLDYAENKIIRYNTFLLNLRSIPWHKKLFIKDSITKFITDTAFNYTKNTTDGRDAI